MTNPAELARIEQISGHFRRAVELLPGPRGITTLATLTAEWAVGWGIEPDYDADVVRAFTAALAAALPAVRSKLTGEGETRH